MSDVIELDARRLLCPLPVIRLQDCINQQAPGVQVKVFCTDPGTMNDIPAWCRINGHQLLESEECDHEFIFVVEKSADGS